MKLCLFCPTCLSLTYPRSGTEGSLGKTRIGGSSHPHRGGLGIVLWSNLGVQGSGVPSAAMRMMAVIDRRMNWELRSIQLAVIW